MVKNDETTCLNILLKGDQAVKPAVKLRVVSSFFRLKGLLFKNVF
jgi:hypothetical protein